MATITGSDIRKALRAADIDFEVEHAGTEVESFHVTRPDNGRVLAFGEARTGDGEPPNGVDIAWHREGLDSDVTSQDWVETTDALIGIARGFLA